MKELSDYGSDPTAGTHEEPRALGVLGHIALWIPAMGLAIWQYPASAMVMGLSAVVFAITNTVYYRGKVSRWLVFLGYLVLEVVVAAGLYILTFIALLWVAYPF